MGVTAEIVPRGMRTSGVGHHLPAVLPAVVVVRLPGGPVGVRWRCAIAPGISFLVVDADQISSPRSAVLISCSPALLLGPVHVVEELQPINPTIQCWKGHMVCFYVLIATLEQFLK